MVDNRTKTEREKVHSFVWTIKNPTYCVWYVDKTLVLNEQGLHGITYILVVISIFFLPDAKTETVVRMLAQLNKIMFLQEKSIDLQVVHLDI